MDWFLFYGCLIYLFNLCLQLLIAHRGRLDNLSILYYVLASIPSVCTFIFDLLILSYTLYCRHFLIRTLRWKVRLLRWLLLRLEGCLDGPLRWLLDTDDGRRLVHLCRSGALHLVLQGQVFLFFFLHHFFFHLFTHHITNSGASIRLGLRH